MAVKITLSDQALSDIIGILEAYKLNSEIADLNLFGPDHPYCNDPNRYKKVQHYIDRLNRERSKHT